MVKILNNIDDKDDTKTMYEDEKRIEQPDRVVELVAGILEFNNQNQKGNGLKI